MNEKTENKYELKITLLFLIIVAAAVFFVDYLTPRGYLNWFFYLVIIFYTSLKLPKKYIMIFGYAGAVLTALGYFVSSVGVGSEFAAVNRMIGILIVWMLTSLLYNQSKENDLKNEIKNQFSILLNRMSTTGIIYFDGDGNITVSNKKFADFLGYRMDEIIGKNILEFIHPDYRGSFLISREKLYFKFQNSDFFEGKLIKKNKETAFVNIALNVSPGLSDNSLFFTAYFNLTGREEAADYLPASKILFKEISG